MLKSANFPYIRRVVSFSKQSKFEKENVRPEKFQLMEKGQNRNFDYKIVIFVKNM